MTSKKTSILPFLRLNVQIISNRMLQIEKEFGLDATYDVLGSLLARKKKTIQASNPRHSIAFHSFNHRLEDLNSSIDVGMSISALGAIGHHVPGSRRN